MTYADEQTASPIRAKLMAEIALINDTLNPRFGIRHKGIDVNIVDVINELAGICQQQAVSRGEASLQNAPDKYATPASPATDSLTRDMHYTFVKVEPSEIWLLQKIWDAVIYAIAPDDRADTVKRVIDALRPFLHTTEPVSVSLEECKSAVEKTINWDSEDVYGDVAKAVLDAAKAQGVRFEYVN